MNLAPCWTLDSDNTAAVELQTGVANQALRGRVGEWVRYDYISIMLWLQTLLGLIIIVAGRFV